MVNGISGIGEGLDTGQVKEDVNKISEQARKKAQSDQKKAQQVQDEIKKDKQENNHLAKFLSFLLKDLKNDELIHLLYETFFKVYSNKHDTTFLRKSVNIVVIVGFFAPFYWDKIEEYHLTKYYKDIYNPKEILNIKHYLTYIKKLSQHHHDNIPLNIDNLINLLIHIIQEFELNHHKEIANKTTEGLQLFFKEELGIKK